MTKQPASVSFSLPSWLEYYRNARPDFTDNEARMAWVVDAARRNVEEGTGGPFAAAVFERETGNLVSLGVNCVVSAGLSVLHAEIVALSLAQRHFDSYDLSAPGIPPLALYSSAEPCTMCFGAIPWAGVRALSAAARKEDVSLLGFDEGDKVDDWVQCLERRGIAVTVDVCRERARQVLTDYAAGEGVIYSPQRKD